MSILTHFGRKNQALGPKGKFGTLEKKFAPYFNVRYERNVV